MTESNAIFSPCGTWRYRLERRVASVGPIFAYFGINPSTADIENEDQTSMKWKEFTRINGGSRYIAGNPFAYVTPDVKQLAIVDDPVGIENDFYLNQIIDEADILIPCWGNINKVPTRLHSHFRILHRKLFRAQKPVKIFGLTKEGHPKHPLMLGYKTPLVDWY